jgi:hypothetical protein
VQSPHRREATARPGAILSHGVTPPSAHGPPWTCTVGKPYSLLAMIHDVDPLGGSWVQSTQREPVPLPGLRKQDVCDRCYTPFGRLTSGMIVVAAFRRAASSASMRVRACPGALKSRMRNAESLFLTTA